MSYICDGCGKTAKLLPTKNGKYLCKACISSASIRKMAFDFVDEDRRN